MSRISGGFALDLTKTERIAARNNQFELHCMQMQLARPTPADHVYGGPGVIRQSPSGQLEFTLYSTRVGSLHQLIPEILGSDDFQTGQVIPEERLYSLRARDILGREWTSNRILIDKHSSPDGTLCTGSLDQITFTTVPPVPIKRDHLALDLVGDFNIPANVSTQTTTTEGDRTTIAASLRTLEFQAGSFDFRLTKEEGILQIGVSAELGEIEEHFSLRLAETLQFIFARSVQWVLLRRHLPTSWDECVRTTRSKESRNKLDAPVPLTSEEAFCTLFANYLRFILSEGSVERLHPLSAQMRAICNASSGSIEAKALTICVAVEGILDLVPMSNESLSPEEMDWFSRAQSCFKTWGGPDRLTKRINGSLARLSKPSTPMRLQKLAEAGIITQSHIDAWQRLRHKLAHGTTSTSEPIQRLIDLTNTVLGLFYLLVFHIIGYTGSYIDYSTKGWPTRHFTVATKL